MRKFASCRIATKSELKSLRNRSQTEFTQTQEKQKTELSLIIKSLNKESVVQIETMPIYKTIPIDSNYIHTLVYPLPPPPDLIHYSNDFFILWLRGV